MICSRGSRRNEALVSFDCPTWILAVSLSFLASAGKGMAGPPLEFDDPDTPGAGHWEINFASTMEKRASLWEFKPLLDLNYGWGERVQLKLKPRFVVLDPPGEGSRAGAGNIQFGVKWRFFDEAKHGIAISVYPQADFNPPGRSIERGLVDNGHDLFLPLQIARTFGRARLYADSGYNWREGREDEWILGLAADYRLRDKFVPMMELRDLVQADFDDHELFFNAGFKLKLHEHWTLLAAAGRTVYESRGERAAVFSYLGLQLLF
ncbi:MAG: hypothetical protein L0Y58_24280 [Verrucomicrobia subdivision 3 bacterium]|nr:hypothetical protein [Limisphaerales bacterium]